MAVDHYCTVSDVNAKVPQAPFGATSRPDETAITDLIEEVATQMDASLANLGYVTPVVEGAQALTILKAICASGVIGIAMTMRSTNVATAVNAGAKETENIWEQRYRRTMAQLADVNDPFELPDAPRTDEQVEKDLDAQARSFVDTLDACEFDADHPSVTRSQVF